MQSSITTYLNEKHGDFVNLRLEEHHLSDGGYVQYSTCFLTLKFSKLLFDALSKLEFHQPIVKMYDNYILTPRKYLVMSDEDTPWIEEVIIIKNKLEDVTGVKFSYVLVNCYRDGDDHISYHSDREAIGEGRNIICSVSVGATRKFVMKNKKERIQFLLNNGSLLIMKGDETQIYWKHGVPKTKSCKKMRYNLTFRQS